MNVVQLLGPDSTVRVATLLERSSALPDLAPIEPISAPAPISVVVCTHERPALLRGIARPAACPGLPEL